MRILDILLKDLTQILRDKMSLIFLVAMPIAFTFFMGFAFQGVAEEGDPRPVVGWINLDPDGEVSQLFYRSLSTSDSLRLSEFDPQDQQEANRQVFEGELAAAIMVPAGFSRSALAGETPQITLIVDSGSGLGQSMLEIVRIPVTRLMSAVSISLLHDENLPPDQFSSQQDVQAEILAAFHRAGDLWEASAQSGPLIVLEKAVGDSSSDGGFDLAGNPYNQTSPGTLVQFAIFSLVTSATILVKERKTRTLERMMTTSLSRAGVVAGHFLAMFALVLLQQVILIAFGQLVLGVDYLREPLATLLVMLALALWAASMGLLIGVIARSEDRVVLYSMIFMFLFSALGGAWFPLETTGRVFAAIGKMTPGAWAMIGFQNILLRGLGLASVMTAVAVILAYAAGFFALAVWRLRAD